MNQMNSPLARLLAGLGVAALLFGASHLNTSQAQEEEEEGTSLFSIDLDDIDLGDDSSLEETITYQGTASHAAPNYKPGTRVTITHYAGTISVRCTDSKGLTARLQYTIDGTDKSAMERYGKAIHIATWASNSSASVKTTIPGKYKGVSAVDLPLVVNLPLQANVVVNGREDWIQIMGCEGTVQATTRKNGIYVHGTHNKVVLSSTTGNVEADLTDEILAALNRGQPPAGTPAK